MDPQVFYLKDLSGSPVAHARNLHHRYSKAEEEDGMLYDELASHHGHPLPCALWLLMYSSSHSATLYWIIGETVQGL